MAQAGRIVKCTSGGEVWLYELSANGVNRVRLKGPDALSGDILFVFPDSHGGAAGGFLSDDGAGVLSVSEDLLIAATGGMQVGTTTAQELALVTNGTNRVRINSDGVTGVGMAPNASHKLAVSGADINAFYAERTGSGTGYAGFFSQQGPSTPGVGVAIVNASNGNPAVTGTTAGAGPALHGQAGNASTTIIGHLESAHNAAMAFRIKEATFTRNSGSSELLEDFIPAGSIVLGVSFRILTAVTQAAGDQVDIGSIHDGVNVANRYGSYTTSTELTLGATGNSATRDQQSEACPPGGVLIYDAAADLDIAAVGGDFTGGQWRVCLHYITLTAPTS